MSQSSLMQRSKRRVVSFHQAEYNPSLPIVFASKEHETLWYSLRKCSRWMKPMVACLAPHKETMTALGIQSKVYDLFGQAGLDIDNIMSLPAHADLVYEFISSFKVAHGESKFDDHSAWEFRIQNTNYRWSRRQVTNYLDFPEYGMQVQASLAQTSALWTKLTGLKHVGLHPSPYSLKCEGWRYVHRLIATNIIGSPETVDNVCTLDLNIMWALDQGDPIDWFVVFSNQFEWMKKQVGIPGFVGCTSLITLIAEMCGFLFHCQPTEHRALDQACLRKMYLLRRVTLKSCFTDTEYDTESEEDPEEPEEDPEEPNEVPEPEDTTQKEATQGEHLRESEINDKINWTKVRKIVVYEF